MADSNACGIAAMTHSNRCISLIDTGLMKRVAHIDGLRRTVWTLCFHPYKQNLLATGNLGGTVCVFDHTVSNNLIYSKISRKLNNDIVADMYSNTYNYSISSIRN